MPHLMKTLEDREQIRPEASQSHPFGPEFSNEQINQAAKMEVWGSQFHESGGDYVEFKLFCCHGQLIAQKRIGGY
jgi:hypothetical protein